VARQYLQKVLETGMKGFTEYASAHRTLNPEK